MKASLRNEFWYIFNLYSIIHHANTELKWVFITQPIRIGYGSAIVERDILDTTYLVQDGVHALDRVSTLLDLLGEGLNVTVHGVVPAMIEFHTATSRLNSRRFCHPINTLTRN